MFLTRKALAGILSGGGPTRLFWYDAGASVTGLGGTFTRADASTCATYVDASGVVQTVAANVIRDAHYVSGNRTVLLEVSRTNDLVQSRDLTAANWTATTCTVARSTGADGVSNSGSRLTATAGNATVMNAALVHASQARAAGLWVKRVTGTGAIQVTLDNGVTWTAITVTGTYTAVPNAALQTLANSQFGIRIVTSGDAVDVDYCQNEAGSFSSSAIPTTTAAVTRAADALSFPFLPVPQAMTVYVKGIQHGFGYGCHLLRIGNLALSGAGFSVFDNGTYNGQVYARWSDGATASDSVPATVLGINRPFEFRATLSPAGVATAYMSVDGADEVPGPPGAAVPLTSAFSERLLTISSNIGPFGQLSCERLRIAAGVQSLNTMRAV